MAPVLRLWVSADGVDDVLSAYVARDGDDYPASYAYALLRKCTVCQCFGCHGERREEGVWVPLVDRVELLDGL